MDHTQDNIGWGTPEEIDEANLKFLEQEMIELGELEDDDEDYFGDVGDLYDVQPLTDHHQVRMIGSILELLEANNHIREIF